MPAVFDPDKTTLRGVLHQWFAVVAVIAGAILVATAPTSRGAWGAAAFVGSLVTLLTVSATYHRVPWGARGLEWMRRADHGAIFVLIAGTYSAFSILALPSALGDRLLVMVWSGAGVGILQSIFWADAPKVLIAALYVALGWIVAPYFWEVRAALGPPGFAMVLAGGIAYSVGALFYALERPNPVPGIFGYHEVFHALTVVAGSLHFAAIARLVGAAR